jgi:hypothetical protein
MPGAEAGCGEFYRWRPEIFFRTSADSLQLQKTLLGFWLPLLVSFV